MIQLKNVTDIIGNMKQEDIKSIIDGLQPILKDIESIVADVKKNYKDFIDRWRLTTQNINESLFKSILYVIIKDKILKDSTLALSNPDKARIMSRVHHELFEYKSTANQNYQYNELKTKLKAFYTPEHYGELAHALLMLLNNHHVVINPQDDLKAKEEVEGLITAINYKPSPFDINHPTKNTISWNQSTCAEIDPCLGIRLDELASKLDEHFNTIDVSDEFRRLLNVELDNLGDHSQFHTLVLWDRHFPRPNELPNSTNNLRRLGINAIIQVIGLFKKNMPTGKIPRIILLGDKPDLANDTLHELSDVVDLRGKHLNLGDSKLSRLQQVLFIRQILKKVKSKLILGPRSGLTALCSVLAGSECMSLQLVCMSPRDIPKKNQHKIINLNQI